MNALEQKRFDYIKTRHSDDEKYSDAKVEFLVRTGLTFDPSAISSRPNKDWYYPKGAGFAQSQNSRDDSELLGSIVDFLNTDEDGPDVTSVNTDTGEETNEHLNQDDYSASVLTNNNGEVITDKDGNIIITND